MANSTARTAINIHGTNPQFLIEKVIRSRIYDSPYWKEHCFAINAATFVDRSLEDLTYLGGTFGLQKPTKFICLLCKLLQIQPEKEIILEYLNFSKKFKYLRAVTAFYIRLTFPSFEIFDLLEPMLNDYSKLRFRQMNGQYSITYMDEFIDQLLTQERVCELILPRLTRRDVLEEVEGLAPRISKLEDVLMNKGGNVEEDDESEASDDSAKMERIEKQRRIHRAQKIRQSRREEEERRKMILKSSIEAKNPKSGELTLQSEIQEEEEYGSQEESDGERFISRSPSRSISEGRFQSRSPSRSPDRQSDGYKSRSVSRSPDRRSKNGYISRSVSRSPDRA